MGGNYFTSKLHAIHFVLTTLKKTRMAHKTVGQTFRGVCKDGNEEKVNAALVLMEWGDVNKNNPEGRTVLVY